jgi:hypothetical protein
VWRPLPFPPARLLPTAPPAEPARPTWQPPSRRRPFAHDHLAEPVGDAPVRRQPGQRVGMARSRFQDRARHQPQRAQVERTGQTLPDQFGRPRLAHFHPLAKLPRQDPAAVYGQVSLADRLGDRGGKNIRLDGGKIELPRRHTRAARRRGEVVQRRGRPAGRQGMGRASPTWPRRGARGRGGRRPRRFGLLSAASGSGSVTNGAGWGADGAVSQEKRYHLLKGGAGQRGSRSPGRRAGRSRAWCAGRDALCGA